MSIEDIRDAVRRFDGLIKRTPLLSSSLLNEFLGARIFFKAECFQHAGAFKSRGALNAIKALQEDGSLSKYGSVVTFSSGNHAQGLAWAATAGGVKSTVFMPANTSSVKKQATRSYGADVVECATRQEAEAGAKDFSSRPNTVMVPPYNHKYIIAGQGTAALEALEDLASEGLSPSACFAPVGGGGLCSGTLIATRALAPSARVYGCEPLPGNDAAESLRQGRIVRLADAPNTICDGARTLAIGDLTFAQLKASDGIFEIPDAEAIYWTQWLSHLLKIEVEPTSALAMAGALHYLRSKECPENPVLLIILSGGNMDAACRRQVWATDLLSVLPRRDISFPECLAVRAKL